MATDYGLLTTGLTTLSFSTWVSAKPLYNVQVPGVALSGRSRIHLEIGNTIQQQKPGFTIESRDKVYLIGFVVAAGLLLFLGRGLVQGSALRPGD